jgi:hypothetical protein
MSAMTPLLRPAFEWNHDYVMASGARGLSRVLRAPVTPVRRAGHRSPLKAGFVAALAGAVIVATGLLAWRRSRPAAANPGDAKTAPLA